MSEPELVTMDLGEVWQVDFYRRPLQNNQGEALWELVVCDLRGEFQACCFCPQAAATATWLGQQLQQLRQPLPGCIQVFRPQSLSLVQTACGPLGIEVQATRRTPALKKLLRERTQVYPQMPEYSGQPYEPTAVDSPPPLPLPELYQGEQWRFAALSAKELETGLIPQPMPLQDIPKFLYPSQLQLAAQIPIPGVVIDGGRRALKLARWLQAQVPVELKFIRGEPSGLVLASGLWERWVLLTFDDPEIQQAGLTFEQRKQVSQGLHFLLVEPDDSGVTYTGLWLLQPPE